MPPNEVVTWRLDLAQLPALLPSWLEKLSPGRALVVADQIRSAITDRSGQKLSFLAAMAIPADQRSTFDGSTAIPHGLVILESRPPTDGGNVLHAGWIDASDSSPVASLTEATRLSIIETLQKEIVAQCRISGVTFLQWSTDPMDANGSGDAWPVQMGFVDVGTLQFMSVDMQSKTSSVETDPSQLELRPLNHDAPGERTRFDSLVAATYFGSLDCPALERFRTSAQIVQSYRVSATFTPELWFTIHERPDSTGPIGVVILSRYANQETNRPALELVYMGVTPEFRGRGFGSLILNHVRKICRNESASQLLMAADCNNHPAMKLYQGIGGKNVLKETVWMTRLGHDSNIAGDG